MSLGGQKNLPFCPTTPQTTPGGAPTLRISSSPQVVGRSARAAQHDARETWWPSTTPGGLAWEPHGSCDVVAEWCLPKPWLLYTQKKGKLLRKGRRVQGCSIIRPSLQQIWKCLPVAIFHFHDCWKDNMCFASMFRSLGRSSGGFLGIIESRRSQLNGGWWGAKTGKCLTSSDKFPLDFLLDLCWVPVPFGALRCPSVPSCPLGSGVSTPSTLGPRPGG